MLDLVERFFIVQSDIHNAEGVLPNDNCLSDGERACNVHVNTYKNKIELSHPMRLTDESAASHGNDNSSISTTNIQKILGIDKVVSTHVGDSPSLMVSQNSNVSPARTYLLCYNNYE